MKKWIAFFLCSLVLFSDTHTQETLGQDIEYFKIETPEQGEWISVGEFDSLTVEFLSGQDYAVLWFDFYEEERFQADLDHESGGKRFSDIVFPGTFRSLKVKSSGNVHLHLYNSQKNSVYTGTTGEIQLGSINIVSRAQWGADERLRYDYSSSPASSSLNAAQPRCQGSSDQFPNEFRYARVETHEGNNQLKWPRQYSQTINKVVVHHTAESLRSSTVPGGDKIRSVYHYHAQTLGWGDIGYNYLIDQDGIIYEGRAGGHYVVGGHVYCHNINTIGVSLMGNFSISEPSEQAIASLSRLLQELGKVYSLDLSGNSLHQGKTAPVLLGHRDLGATACPGDNLYNILPVFRKHFAFSGTNFGLQEQVQGTQFSAKLSGRPSVIEAQAYGRIQTTVVFENTGNVSWRKGTWLYAPDNSLGNPLRAEPILIDKDYVVANMREDTVSPGGKAHFDITLLTANISGTHSLELIPIVNGERKLSSASILLAVEVKNTEYDYEFITAVHPQNPVFFGQKKEAKVVLKNTGNTVWYRSGKNAITLDVPHNKTSVFASSLAPKTYAWMEEESVAPGKLATFNFELYTDFTEGTFEIPFLPRIAGTEYLKDVGMKFTLQVKKPVYKAQLLLDSSRLTFQPSETKTLRIGLKNFSNTLWQENQISLRLIQGNGLQFHQNAFFIPEEVLVSGVGYTEMNVTAPAKSGTYTAQFQALANGKRFTDTRYIEIPITVNEAEFTGKITYISPLPESFRYGSSTKVTVRIRNTGNITWRNSGPQRIFISALSPRSQFQSSDWESSLVVSGMENDAVSPGQVATFIFPVELKTLNAVKEFFQIKNESLGGVSGGRFFLEVEKKLVGMSLVEQLKQKVIQKREDIEIKLAEMRSKIEAERLKREQIRKNTENIRIKLSFFEPSINIFAEEEAEVFLDSRFVRTIKKSDSLWTRKEGNKIILSINGQKSLGNILRVVPKKGVLRVENWKRSPEWNPNIFDNTFEGVLEVQKEGDSVVLINELSFERYLSGVAEVPEGEEHEKKKVMAVIARSYALHYLRTSHRKFPGMPYDGSDSPAEFQKYLGYNYTLRSPLWQKALKETEGEVLMYNNEILRTAYFSCSSGRTKSASQAGWGEYFDTVKEVYQSQDDSFGADMEKYKKGLCGHGVGLSGKGTQHLALSGWKYQDILHYYYKNVELQKIQ
jgi:hypothetical protein